MGDGWVVEYLFWKRGETEMVQGTVVVGGLDFEEVRVWWEQEIGWPVLGIRPLMG